MRSVKGIPRSATPEEAGHRQSVRRLRNTLRSAQVCPSAGESLVPAARVWLRPPLPPSAHLTQAVLLDPAPPGGQEFETRPPWGASTQSRGPPGSIPCPILAGSANGPAGIRLPPLQARDEVLNPRASLVRPRGQREKRAAVAKRVWERPGILGEDVSEVEVRVGAVRVYR